MGWDNVFHCEWNPFGQKILKHYWPNSISYADITTTDFAIHQGRIDILTGGFPCQPFSLAGKRKGTDDNRYLWPEMLRAIREIQPQWVVGENVYGLVNWDGGMVFDKVCADLEAEGYEVQPVILPACGKNAPHKRDRIWFIAYSNSYGQQWGDSQYEEHTSEGREHAQCNLIQGFANGTAANTNHTGIQGRAASGHTCKERKERHQLIRRHIEHDNWRKFPTQSPIHCRNDGFSSRLDGLTLSKHRQESIKGFGNAIVPQMALEIFQIIEQMNKAA